MTPGFHPDVPETEYHADRTSLSVSGAKVLLKAPALFKWQQDNPVHKDVFDIGSAAHSLVLGVGATIVAIDHDSWRTKAAQQERDEARADGYTPLLTADYVRVQEMADALSSHTLAMRLLSEGEPEVSAYAIDEPTGVLRRGRFDWLGSRVLTDIKTAVSSEPSAFANAAAKFGYFMQAAWYLDLARDLGHPAEAFAFVVIEKTPPYLVTVCELSESDIALGRTRNREALERFRDCRDADRWPGYLADDEIARIRLPRWAHYDTDLEIA